MRKSFRKIKWNSRSYSSTCYFYFIIQDSAILAITPRSLSKCFSWRDCRTETSILAEIYLVREDSSRSFAAGTIPKKSSVSLVTSRDAHRYRKSRGGSAQRGLNLFVSPRNRASRAHRSTLERSHFRVHGHLPARTQHTANVRSERPRQFSFTWRSATPFYVVHPYVVSRHLVDPRATFVLVAPGACTTAGRARARDVLPAAAGLQQSSRPDQPRTAR
jgi:hypothetical protein